MNNPLKSISKKEWIIWICSVLTIAISNLVIGDVDFLIVNGKSDIVENIYR